MALQPSEFLVITKVCSAPSVRLVCFPHSGGGPSAFASWPELLDEKKVEVVAISAPGRERRIDAEPFTNWEALVGEICTALDDSGVIDDVPYAFYGHSFGAVLAYETARRLDSTLKPFRPRPVHVFVSAHHDPATIAKTGVNAERKFRELDGTALLKAVESFGFLPEELAADENLAKAVLPALRADLNMYETWTAAPDRKPLSCSITALGGRDDTVPEAAISGWGQETAQRFEHKLFPGGHFYVDACRDELLLFLHEQLQASLKALPLSIGQSRVALPQHIYTTTFQDVVRQKAAANPDVEAIIDEHERLTLKELVYRTDLLAMQLLSMGLKKLDVVALLRTHDISYVIGFMAIYTANTIFLVIEAHFPPELAKEIGEESGCKAAMCSPEYTVKFEGWCELGIFEMGENWVDQLKNKNVQAAIPNVDVKDICILMMTSGTTGRPKTIAGSNYFMTVGQYAKALSKGYTKGDRHAHNVMFVWEVMAPIMFDLPTFCIPDAAVLDPQLFVKFLEQWQCTRTLTTPSLLGTIIKYCSVDLGKKLASMTVWLACGEVLPLKTVYQMRELCPNVKIVNDYSTWESGDIAYAIVDPDQYYVPSKVFACAGYLAVGNCSVIVDPDTREILPRGVPGELFVGGPNMSYGYFGKPELTAEKFRKPWCKEMEELWPEGWYKCGDLGRFVGDPPVLEIRGRIDSTVKIRGFKVGIPVVEAAIQECPGIAMAAVAPMYSAPGTVDSLCAFITPHDGVEFDAAVQSVKKGAVKKIPRWMLPTYFKPMPDSCLSGGEARKLNRQKLKNVYTLEQLKAEAAAQQAANEAEAPEEGDDVLGGGVRGIVRKVWAKMLNLNVRTLDLEENFFDLGGHSTLAARMAAELAGEYGLPITVLDIYSNSSLGALLDLLDPQGAVEVAVAAPRRGRVRLLTGAAEEARLAIVGIAGKFPGADDPDTFWQNLSKGAVAATFFSPEFLRKKGVAEDVINNKEFVPCGYMINNADKFDSQYFGIGRHEATIMDPQHRVFIESVHEAFENAALAPRSGLADDVVGVFAAAGIDGYLVHHLDGLPLKDTMDPQDIFLAEIGSEKDYIATRVAYLLDLTGPAMNVNSACSSALVACSQAASAISSGQCDSAVFGASSITFPNLGFRYQDGLVNSVDGYVRPFDASADGTVFGDSVGACILRRMDDVLATPGSLVWSAVRGFAVSNDGAQKAGYAAPSSTGQSQAIMGALNLMQTDPWSLSYVECHCTGTRVGDGIEINGLKDAFAQVGGKKENGQASVALGSVKGNIAHANCAAGMTGLIKVLLMARSSMVAPTANFKTLNPKIKLDDTPFYVNSELCKWDIGSNKTVRSAVSAFGIGGTNAHIVVEEAPAPAPAESTNRCGYEIFTFSAKSPEALKQGVERVAEHVRKHAEVGDADVPNAIASCAYTLQTGRAALPLRKTLVVPSKVGESSLTSTATWIEENVPSIDDLENLEESRKKPAVVFLFPGQGSQYLGMGAGLYASVSLYRQAVDRCCDILMTPELLGRDLRPILLSSDSANETEFSKPSVLQPCLFVIEYAMLQLLTALGVTPVAAGGHSLGEYSACVCGGLLTLEAALKIVVERSKSTETLAEDGAMLSVSEWSDEELQAIRNREKPGLWLAAINSPVHAVISGEVSAIEALETELKAASRSCTRLHIKKAFHSGLISKAADTLKGLGVPEADATSTVPIASNYSGGWMTASMLQDGTYWSNHMRNPVLWRENAEKMLSQWTPAVVLEVGPGNALSMLTKKCVEKDAASVPTFVQTMRHPKSATHDVEHFLTALGQLWELGYDVQWPALHKEVLDAAVPPAPTRLPPYAFAQTSLWENPGKSAYVEGDAQPQVSAGPTSATAQSKCLVRFADPSDQEPSLRAYCLPFAGGSSMLFAPWAAEAGTAIDVVAIELPGRGKDSDARLPASDADDAKVLATLAREISADLRGLPYVLVGFSMGGNLSVELTMHLAMQNAPLPLAVYIAGRKPPASHPAAIANIDWTDEALSQYAMAPEEIVKSDEFQQHALPLLRADLELDLRVERRLSTAISAGKVFPHSVPLEVFCGTNDNVAPWSEAASWEKLTQVPVGVHFMPGGHEFLTECRPMLLSSWKRDAIGRLVQRRSAELATLAAMGFTNGGALGPMSPVPAGAPSAVAKAAVPLYSVRWLQVTPKPMGATAAPTHFLDLAAEISQGCVNDAIAALQNGLTLILSCTPIYSVLKNQSYDVELKQCWNFVHLIQHVLEAGAAGRIVIACPVAETCGMVIGASKAVAMEASELKFQRIFIPLQCLNQARSHVASLMTLAERYPEETDLWVKESASDSTFLKSPIFAPKLERMLEPSSKISCLPKHCADGEPATYLLTGATGGLGSAVVEWIAHNQSISPEQIVLLRRAGSSALNGTLAKCRVVEVSNPDDYSSLTTSGLKDIHGVSGIFHLAGILDDGVIGGMTPERMSKVAKPKSGMALALLKAAKAFNWPVKWFLAFSSTSSLFGYGGQVNYCAANGMLDQLAVFGADSKITNGDSLPCRVITINWGPWGEAGMSKVGTKAYELAVKEGDTPLKTTVALRCLAAVLRSTSEARGGAAQFAACDVQWQRSQWSNLPVLELVTEAQSQKAPSSPEVKSSSTGGSVEEFMATYASSPWSRISKKSLAQLGMDSLEVVQMRNSFNKRFGVNVPQRVVADPSQRLNDLVKALEAYVGN
mmetsp:Transcript_26999/g.49634  ORF Transcript_26999/g.49634 Transcript_26999/m.49634 type:complete len:2699 (+) Transcript_26999:91-8187(+)